MITRTVFQLVLIFIVSCGFVKAEAVQQQLDKVISLSRQHNVIVGKDGWLFLKEEIEHLQAPVLYGNGVKAFSKVTKKQYADPLPAIVDFNKQLEEKGIELLFVLIPPKALIYPEKLPIELSGDMVKDLKQPYKDLNEKLADNNVQVLDLLPLFHAERNHRHLYSRIDTHYSGEGVVLVARQIAKLVQQRNWYEGIAKKNYKKKNKLVTIEGDLSRMLGGGAKEELLFSFVTDLSTKEGGKVFPQSPVLLIGDSHTLVYSIGGDLHTKSAGLFDHLSAELSFPIDRIGVRGSGATPSRIKLYQRSRKDPNFLKTKKMIIWCLSARELTGTGGWRKIPISKN